MTKTILLADDSVTIQKVVELTFMDQDYEVVAVSDGKAALAKLAEQPPSLLIADVHMPGADGYEVCRNAKQSYPDLPVLLLVGTFEPFDENQAVAVGADGHLKKPFDSQDLLAQVDALVGRAAPLPAVEPPPAAAPAVAVSELEPPPLTEDWKAPDAAAAAAADFPEPNLDDAVAGETMAVDPEAAAAAEADADPVASFTRPIQWPAGEAAEPAIEAEEPRQAASATESEEPAAPAEPHSEPATEPAAAAVAAAPADDSSGALGDRDVDRIARRVAELVGEKMLRDVAWEVVPDLAELIIKERIRELESQVE